MLVLGPPIAPGSEDGDEEAGEAPGCKGWYDLQAVATHEAGHFFGLDEDLHEAGSTMYFKTAKCELRKRDLDTPDRSVLTTLCAGAPPTGDPAAATDTGAGCGGGSIVTRAPSSGARSA